MRKLIFAALVLGFVSQLGDPVASANDNNIFYACMENGKVLPETIQVGTPPVCEPPRFGGERIPVSWSQVGPPGPTGPQGFPGPVGPTGAQGPAGTAGQVFFQVSQSDPFTPPTGTGSTLNPAEYTTITGLSMTVNVPAQSFLLVTAYGDVGNTNGGAVRADVAVFIDSTFNFTIQPPRSLTVEASGFTPYAMSFAVALTAGNHTFSVRGQNYAGATAGVFGQTSPGLLTVAVIKQ